MNHDDLTELQQDLNNAKHVVFLTGAGVSTHSGIPDYRSKNGIYNGVQENPETILSESTLYNRPEFFYHRCQTKFNPRKNCANLQRKRRFNHAKYRQIGYESR